MSLYCFQRFCKASDCAFNATKLLKLMKFEQDMCSASEGGHGDVSWQLSLVCILELKIFGRHSIVFPFQKGL
jgi:hypothetical protein